MKKICFNGRVKKKKYEAKKKQKLLIRYKKNYWQNTLRIPFFYVVVGGIFNWTENFVSWIFSSFYIILNRKFNFFIHWKTVGKKFSIPNDNIFYLNLIKFNRKKLITDWKIKKRANTKKVHRSRNINLIWYNFTKKEFFFQYKYN